MNFCLHVDAARVDVQARRIDVDAARIHVHAPRIGVDAPGHVARRGRRLVAFAGIDDEAGLFVRPVGPARSPSGSEALIEGIKHAPRRAILARDVHKRALLLALAFAALGAALLYVYLRRFEQEASGGAPVKLLVALKPLTPGTLLTDEMLATREVPVAYVENRAVRDNERAKVVGLRVSTPVQAQQTLMWTDLAIAADDRRDLSSLVQPGMRAVSVRATNDDKSFALIRPGDRVDVIATMPTSDTSAQRESVVLLQNVLVLAVGLDTGSEPAAKRVTSEPRDLLLSLSVTVPEAQLLALAVEKGRLQVALRNPDDVRTTEGLSDMTSSALTDSKARANVQGGRKSGPVRLESQDLPRGGTP